MDEEVVLLKDMIEKLKTQVHAGVEFYSGKLRGHDVCLVRSGIGKVNGAMATTLLIELFSPEFIVNTGCAGGTKDFLNIGDIVISDSVLHHDADNTCFGYKFGQIPREPEMYLADKKLASQCLEILSESKVKGHLGQVASGDSFMCDPERIAQAKARFPQLHALDMEAAGIAQAAHKYAVPFVIARALSDIAGKESVDYRQFLPTAVKLSSDLVLALLERSIR